MSGAYWLGFFTLPAMAIGGLFATGAYFGAVRAFAKVGISWELRWSRDTAGISDYTLRRDIWWERGFGPVFIGGWYREPQRYMEPRRALATRWVGFGPTDGPNLTVFHVRDLGEVEDRT